VRVVLDTNVLLAAFAARGLCEAVLEVCLTSHEIVLCEHILKELHRALRRKLKVPAAHADDIIAFLRKRATVVRPAKVPTKACKDRSDLPILGAAVAGGAGCLITGDRELLALGEYEGVRILPPRTFHDGIR